MGTETEYSSQPWENFKRSSGLESLRSQMMSANESIASTPPLLRAFIGILLLMVTPLVFAVIIIVLVGKILLSILKEALRLIGAVFLILIVGVPLYLYFALTLPFRRMQAFHHSQTGSQEEANPNNVTSMGKQNSRSGRKGKSPVLN